MFSVRKNTHRDLPNLTANENPETATAKRLKNEIVSSFRTAERRCRMTDLTRHIARGLIRGILAPGHALPADARYSAFPFKFRLEHETMSQPSLPRLGFIGAGRLARCLALSFSRAGYPVTAMASRSAASAGRLAGQIGHARHSTIHNRSSTLPISSF